MFWLGQYGGLTSRGIEFAWRLFLWIGLIFSLFAFFQHITSPGSIFGIEKPYHAGRLTGSFLSSNTAATFLGVIVVTTIAQIYRTWRISYSKAHDSETKVLLDMLQNTVLPASTFLFAFVSLLLTASRAGIATTFCVVFLFILWVLSQIMFQKSTFGNVRLGPAILLTSGLVAVFVLFWQISGGNVAGRYDSVFDDVSDRASMLKASYAAYQYKPIFGHGLGSLNEAKLLGVDPLTNGSVMSQNASHNFFAQTLVQTGVVGVAVLSILYSIIMVKIVHGIILQQRYSTYLIGIVLISLLVCIHSLFDYALEIPAVMLTHIWFLGLGFGTSIRYAKG
ncbi:MAG: O-antigen ligase family protein [Hyphomonadaceae bacterium]|nr:O-antigen ligase family protein [Hyphomonadaceae bacterium]